MFTITKKERQSIKKQNELPTNGAVLWSTMKNRYDPYAQLTGFIQTGDDTFITRRNDARAIVSSLDREKVAQYVREKMKQTT